MSDIKRETINKKKFSLDEFFYSHFSQQYKLEKLICSACEDTIQSILDHSGNVNNV